MVPNGDIRTVTNRTRVWGRINIDLGIADARQLDAARAAIDGAGQALAADPVMGPAVIEAPHFMTVTAIDDRGVRLMIWGRVRSSDRFAVEGEYRRRLLEALADAGVRVVTASRVDILDGTDLVQAAADGGGRPEHARRG